MENSATFQFLFFINCEHRNSEKNSVFDDDENFFTVWNESFENDKILLLLSTEKWNFSQQISPTEFNFGCGMEQKTTLNFRSELVPCQISTGEKILFCHERLGDEKRQEIIFVELSWSVKIIFSCRWKRLLNLVVRFGMRRQRLAVSRRKQWKSLLFTRAQKVDEEAEQKKTWSEIVWGGSERLTKSNCWNEAHKPDNITLIFM